MARASRFGDRLPLKQYLAASHFVIATYSGVQTIPDKQLAAVGAKRSSFERMPYFGVALQCLPGTELVLTLTSGMTSVIKNDRRLRLVKAPQELHAARFLSALGGEAENLFTTILPSRHLGCQGKVIPLSADLEFCEGTLSVAQIR